LAAGVCYNKKGEKQANTFHTGFSLSDNPIKMNVAFAKSKRHRYVNTTFSKVHAGTTAL
jgi:hypothetical protein